MAGIFKTYDVRGLITDISDDTAYKIGYAFAKLRKEELKKDHLTFIVGRDMRPTSERYMQAIIDGITDNGCNVLDIGLVSTPMFYYACQQDDVQGGVMLTASHNSKEYNGFKICRDHAESMTYDDGINIIESFVLAKQGSPIQPEKERGSCAKKEIQNAYVKFVTSFCQLNKPLKVVVDAGNGMGALEAQLFAPNFMHLQIIPLYFELDGTFPNHQANPTVEENLVDLKKAVLEHGADFGVAFDGDADRVMFVDETGDTVTASQSLALFAQHRLGNQNGSVVGDLLLSKVVEKVVEQHNGEFVKSRVGHSFVHRLMQKTDALVGAEFSGHMYFREFKGADNAILAFANMLTILGDSEQSMSELIDPFDTYVNSGQHNFKVEDTQIALDRIKQNYNDNFDNDLDGYSFESKEVWFNVRASNTEPLLRVTAEGANKKVVDDLIEEISALLQ